MFGLLIQPNSFVLNRKMHRLFLCSSSYFMRILAAGPGFPGPHASTWWRRAGAKMLNWTCTRKRQALACRGFQTLCGSFCFFCAYHVSLLTFVYLVVSARMRSTYGQFLVIGGHCVSVQYSNQTSLITRFVVLPVLPFFTGRDNVVCLWMPLWCRKGKHFTQQKTRP